VRGLHWLSCRLLGTQQAAPPRRLEPASAETMAELLKKLPRATLPQQLLSGPMTFSFAPCSNLCLYLFGVATCLQRATNFDQARASFSYRGVSSGSLVAGAMALNADIAGLYEACLGMLAAINVRRWGWVGAYSQTIREVCVRAMEGKDVKQATAGEKLRLGTTLLSPLPSYHEVSAYETPLDLQQAVLASCFIPVVWEDPIWLRDLGPCLDGGASGFAIDGDVVVSPYHSSVPDLGPEVEYPRALVFQPIDARDMLKLFEDGYRDCLRWIEAGCPSSREQRRTAIAAAVGGGFNTLLMEGWATFLEVSGLRNKAGAK